MVKTNLNPQLNFSNAPALSAGDIHAIKAPVPIPNVWLWVGCAVGVFLLAALAWWLWRRRRQNAPEVPAVPIVPPHRRARAKLEQALALIDQPSPFCTLVSDTIRVYLEERFHLHAPERTTEEFLEELQSSPVLTTDQKRTLGEFLMGCDLVKFARYEPAQNELMSIHKAAVRLVDETEPAPLAVATPAVETPQPR
jgi:hypothetical protein